MEEKREGYAEKIEAQLKEWKLKIEELKTRLDQVDREEVRGKLREKMEILKANFDATRDRWDAVREGSDDAWKDVKEGLEKAWGDLRQAFESAASKLKKEGKGNGEA